MSVLVKDLHTVNLPTGTLHLEVEQGPSIDSLCAFAARSNPKRGFLIVSKVLGRHIPSRPRQMRETMNSLAAGLPEDMPGPIVFLGMAETATALGQGVFAAYRELYPHLEAVYLQTSRQRDARACVLTNFEEGHSHATTHLVQASDVHIEALVRSGRSLVIIDDECSTGGTFKSAATGMKALMPHLQTIHTCCITDWSGGEYLAEMPVQSHRHAVLKGSMRWQAGEAQAQSKLASSSNTPGVAPLQGMRSRIGITAPEAAKRRGVQPNSGERILVLGDGEHSYEALLVAEEIEAKGGIAAVQCITRSPALLGNAMQSVSRFSDAYGSGAPCYLYNIMGHQPDRIVIVTEMPAGQGREATQALHELSYNKPVEVVVCSYHEGEKA